MNAKLKDLFDRIEAWPESDQAELADAAAQIEACARGHYHATPEGLQAIDEADRSGVASEQDVEAAFKTFAAHEG